MRTAKRGIGTTKESGKESWHLYSLQALPTAKFAKVTGQIMRDFRMLAGIRRGIKYDSPREI